MSDFDKKYDIVDEKTPPNSLMTGRYKRSFAYYTLRERVPIIVTQVIDNLSKDKDEIFDNYGEESRDELKEILGDISKLKYELQTDKEMKLFDGNEPDKDMWNGFLNSLTNKNNSYFKACWLWAECYTYRRLKSIFEKKKILRDYDYFRKQKENALTCCADVLETVLFSVQNAEKSTENKGELLITLVKLNLWGNRVDLSISEGKEIKQTGNPFELINSLNEFILIDDSNDIISFLWSNNNSNLTSTGRIIDFVIDNSGYELFTDFILADFLIYHNLASKIRFHCKAIPWFISDATENDITWTLNYLSNHSKPSLNEFGKKWSKYFQNNQFELSHCEYFWTSPYEYYRMNEICPKLYQKLSEADLVIFKGDLNYRKLIGDFTWHFTESFETCLRGFLPSNLCTFRTIKADLICGLKPGVAEILDKKDVNWMITGKYGVIQFASKNDKCFLHKHC